MTSKVYQLEKEMRTLKETSSEANLARNIGSTIQQNYKSTTYEEVEITNEVKIYVKMKESKRFPSESLTCSHA